MSELFAAQGLLFCRLFFYGICFGVSYDLLRVLRRVFSHKLFCIAVEDFLISLIWLAWLVYLLQKYNEGNPRLFLFFGLIAGIIAYAYTISSVFVFTLAYILLFAKKCSKKVKKLLKNTDKTVKIKVSLKNLCKHEK